MREATGNQLLKIAVDWYTNHGLAKMHARSKVGGTETYGVVFYQDGTHFIESNTDDGDSASINNIQGRAIPLLAAISLGFDTQSLLTIINDYSISLGDITGIEFSDIYRTDVTYSNATEKTLTPAKIAIESFKAFCLEQKNTDELLAHVKGHPHILDVLGSINTEAEALWPVSIINEHAEKIMSPRENQHNNVVFWFSDITWLPQSLDELPDRSPIEFTRRIGMLSEPVIRKLTKGFNLWENLVCTAGDDEHIPSEILKSLSVVSHKPTMELIARAIQSISHDTTEELNSAQVHHTLTRLAGENALLRQVVDSNILKLNLLPYVNYTSGDAFGYMEQDTTVFGSVLNDNHLLVSRVAAELFARPAKHLGSSDYYAIKKLQALHLPGQQIDFSPEKLLNHLLDSMNTYISPTGHNCGIKNYLDQVAIDSISELTRLLMRHHDFDYSQFDHRSDRAKIELVRGGFEIKKFTSLSKKAKGNILEEQLGL